MTFEIKIRIKGTEAELSLWDAASGKELSHTKWEDKRDLSSKLFLKLELVLGKNNITLRQVQKVSFDCDSPYFSKKEKWEEMHLENIDGTGKCGFTAWQTGEIISKVMDFALEKK